MNRVVITGMGIYSCIGKNMEEVRDALFQGKSGIILDPERKAKPGSVITIDKLACNAKSAEVAGPEVPQVVAAMSNMASFGRITMCDFDPAIILRFEANGHTLDVMICFHCHEMILYRDETLVRRPFTWAETKNTFTGDARRVFLAMAKKAFPNDTEIQKLGR